MIKLYIIILIVVLLLINSCKKDIKENYFVPYSNKQIFKNHIVSDSNTASKIAETIWVAKYGKNIISQRPYTIKIGYGTDTIWYIKGTIHISDNPKLLSMGGVAQIAIRSKDCKILHVCHGD